MKASTGLWVVFTVIFVALTTTKAHAFSVERQSTGQKMLQSLHVIFGEQTDKDTKDKDPNPRANADPTNSLSLEQHLEKVAGCNKVDFAFDDSKGFKYRAGMKELIGLKKEVDGKNIKFTITQTAVVDGDAYGDDSIVATYQKRKEKGDNPSPIRFQHTKEVWSTKGDGVWKKETFGPFGNKAFECILDTTGPAPRCRVEGARIPRRDRDFGRVRNDYKTMNFTESWRFADSGNSHSVTHQVEKLDGMGKLVSKESGLVSFRKLDARQCETDGGS